MTNFRNYKADPEKAAIRVMRRLLRGLERQHRQLLAFLNRQPTGPGQVVAALDAIRFCAEIRCEVRELLERRNFTHEGSLHFVQSTYSQLFETLRSQPPEYFSARKGFSDLASLLLSAEENLTTSAVTNDPKDVKTIRVEADLIYQAYHSLFPAERMLVLSGRKASGKVTLGAVFDVTGAHSAGHVNADPGALARALIAMDLSNTYLAAWIHSHPGTGPASTLPSSIDRRQHHDWLQDYSTSLVSGILVSDRWLRFWGTAIEEGSAKIEISDHGLVKENPDEELYRLAQ
jgi:hypothetical protein